MKRSSSPPDARFQSETLLVHTTLESIVRAIRQPALQQLGSSWFLSGSVVSPDPGHFDHGKRVFIHLDHIVSITEVDDSKKLFDSRKKPLRLVDTKRDDAS